MDNKGAVVYGQEVKLESIQGCPLELPEGVEQMLGVRRLTGWLIYTENNTYRGHDLVVTEVPARNLYFQGKLQPRIHRKRSEIVREFQKALRKSGQIDPIRAISEGLSALSFQPFESRSRFVSVWLIEPKVIETLSITQHTRDVKIEPGQAMKSPLRGNFMPEAEWSLGICRDIDRCIALLEIDEEKDRLFEKTENGELFEHYRSSKSPGPGPIYRLMTAIAASLREDVYRAAIMSSLAGIDESLYPSGSKDGGRPVMKQVKVLYHQFMYALAKRCHLSNPVLGPSAAPLSDAIPSYEKLQTLGEGLEETGEKTRLPSDEIPAYGAFKTLREELEEMGEKIRLLGQDVFIPGLEKTLAETDGPDETLVHLILAALKEWNLSEKLVSWLRRHQSQFSKAVQTMTYERLRAQ